MIAGCKGPDHINRNGLDNRRINLRAATAFQNLGNQALRSTNKSGYKGVNWNRLRRKWQGSIKIHGRSRHLGMFTDPVDAARAYNAAALEAWGEFAWLNPVPDPVSAGTRSAVPIGTQVHGARLNDEIVLQCRARAAGGSSITMLASEFGVSPAAMSRAVNGVTWRHVPFPDVTEHPAA